MFDAFFGSLAAFGLLRLDPGSHLGEAVHLIVMETTKIFVLLVAEIYVMGLRCG